MRDRVTEREKLRITANYFMARGEMEKAAETCELWEASYPRDYYPHSWLGYFYAEMGQLDKALVETQETLRLAPDSVRSYENLGASYYVLNRLDEAQVVLDQALAHKFDSYELHAKIYHLAFLRADAPQTKQQVDWWAAGKAGAQEVLPSFQSNTEAYYGRMVKSRDFSRRAVDAALRAGNKEGASSLQIDAALREAESGDVGRARQGVSAALALSQGRDVQELAALALARTGDAPRARALLKELQKNYSTDTLLKIFWLPAINAALAVGKGDSTQALLDLEPAGPYELSEGGYLYPAYVRGQAYLLAHNGTAAAAEFQKLLDHRGFMGNFVTGSLAHLQIGRAHAMAGDTAEAKAA